MSDNNIPTISVVMSIYSEKVEWIRESVDSILNQTFSDFEFIIINDNPSRTENSILLEEYRKKDTRIVILTNEQNLGLTKSLNKGIKTAKGKYIARMDADDISLPARFEKQVQVMENNPDIIVCGGRIKMFGRKIIHPFTAPEKSQNIKNLLIKKSCISHPCSIIRKNTLLNNHILYDENYTYAQDYKLWIDLCDIGDFYNIQEFLLRYRCSRVQISYQKKAQYDCSAMARREYIRRILKRKKYTGEIDWNSINISTLKIIKQYDAPLRMLEVFYLSLKIYTIREFLYFVFSFDFIRFPLKSDLSILLCFFHKRAKRL
jgi:glycosyltransferase involved in cell wall biosynthesis